MPNLRKWSQSASGNATVTGGANTINWAEGQAPSTVNNSAREEMAQVRRIYRPDEWGWVEFSGTASIASQTTFKLTGNQTADYTANRRVRLTGGFATVYGAVVSSSFTSETTVTITKDSGSLSASMNIAAVSSAYDKNLPEAATLIAATTTEVLTGTDANKYVTADSLAALWELGASVTATATLALGEGGYFHITGAPLAGITDIDFATPRDGREAICVFTGSATLTHNATTLILPGGANIVTAPGDVARFVQDATDNVRCVAYNRASGLPVVGGAASQAEMEAGVSTAVFSTPGRQHFNPGHPKCLGKVTYAGGTPTLQTSYNITSITDVGVGELTFTIATDFSSVHWTCLALVEEDNATFVTNIAIESGGQTAGAVTFGIYPDDGAKQDEANAVHMVGLGDQA